MKAITSYAVNHGTADVQYTLDNYNLGTVRTLASQASHTLVFVSTDAGEGYITVDGNAGDRVSIAVLSCLVTSLTFTRTTSLCGTMVKPLSTRPPLSPTMLSSSFTLLDRFSWATGQ